MAHSKFTTLVVCAALASSSLVRADSNDGELFPNVKSYDEEVQAPVSKPEKTLEAPKRVVVEAPPKPAPVPTKKVVAAIRWNSRRKELLSPLMTPESQSRFDKEYAPRVKQKLTAKSSDKKEAAEMLWKEAEGSDVAADLKRALWLQSLGMAIRGQTDLDDRSAKAKAVLPLLKEETLPVAQARADAVTELAFGALANASDALLGIVLESQCKLARMQVQGGFPDQAAASLKVARDCWKYLRSKGDAQRDTLAEAAAWVDRATAARALSTRWQETLTKTPNDPFVNTHLAVLNLSLYGDVEKAATFAGKSDKKELKALAGAMAKPADDGVVNAAAVTGALLDLAESAVVQPFDAYAIGNLVKDRLAELIAAGDLANDQTEKVRGLESRADAVISKSGIRRPVATGLAALAEEKSTTGVKTADASKLQLFVKDSATVVKYIKPTPAQDAQALTLIRGMAKVAGEKAQIKWIEIETAHCIIFTNWVTTEHGFLKKNVEASYVAAARQFEYPLNENVFPGKLPVFMLNTQETFIEFGKAVGEYNLQRILGQFHVTDDGIGCLSMFKDTNPRQATPQEAVVDWNRTMTWLMTKAFMARYRTNKALPYWLSIGLPTRVSSQQFPDPAQPQAIQRFLWRKKTALEVLNHTDQPVGYEDQSVASTLVDMLMARDPKAFVTLLNKLKDGEDPEASMKATYKWSYNDVDAMWQKWIQKVVQ